jgi:hypothetical protein
MKRRTGARAGAAAITLALAGCASQQPGPASVLSAHTPGTSGGSVTATAAALACQPRLAAWLGTAGGTVTLRAVHDDLVTSNADVSMINHDVLTSAATTGPDAGRWRSDLQQFQRDVEKLQASPPPACGPGIPLGQAIQVWLRAIAGYQAGAADLIASPDLAGASRAAASVTAAGALMARAGRSASRAARDSGGMLAAFPAVSAAP